MIEKTWLLLSRFLPMNHQLRMFANKTLNI